jgi:hypothetical protein
MISSARRTNLTADEIVNRVSSASRNLSAVIRAREEARRVLIARIAADRSVSDIRP